MRDDDALAGGASSSSQFGPIAKLLGTWEGQRGINVVSLPKYSNVTDVTANFMVLGHEYNETLTFSPIWGKVLNRGYADANQLNPTGQLDQTLMGVTYDLRIVVSATGDLIHAENGQWLWNQAPGIDSQWSVSRMGVVPHGVSLVALGHESSMTGAEVKAELSAMQGSADWIAAPQNQKGGVFGYFEGERTAGCTGEAGSPTDGECSTPVNRLIEDIGPVNNMNCTKLQVSSLQSGGSLSMLPNIREQVENRAFNASFYVETVMDPDGHTYEQLQYAQNVFLAFETNFACRTQPVTEDCNSSEPLILWPHIQVNTLRKVSGRQAEPPSDLPYIR